MSQKDDKPHISSLLDDVPQSRYFNMPFGLKKNTKNKLRNLVFVIR